VNWIGVGGVALSRLYAIELGTLATVSVRAVLPLVHRFWAVRGCGCSLDASLAHTPEVLVAAEAR
jgi:hypothetical protein